MLADFGADVIKIEQPDAGDMLRILSHIPTTPEAGNEWFWQMDGRNKRGLTLNLKAPAGAQVLRKLVSQCDVFITNQPYAIRESLALTYDDLRPLRPNMIYASLTAYGELGAERDRKGFDQLAYWARSGLMDLMREPGTRPTQGLPGMGDHPTAVALYAAIVTALLQRERTGEGAFVHTSLLANGLWSAAGIAGGVVAGGDMQQYREYRQDDPAMLRPYMTKDERWLQFNMVRNEELLSLCLAALDAPELLTNPKFADLEQLFEHRREFGDALQAIVCTQTAEYWLERFAEYQVPVNLVARVEDAATDEQMRVNAMINDSQDQAIDVPRVINHPLKISSVSPVTPTKAPDLGEHSEQILHELGYTPEQIADLRAAGTI